LMEKGIDARLPTLLRDINERDARDAGREVAPLVQCEDARVLDTTGLTVDEAASRVLDWFEASRSRQPRFRLDDDARRAGLDSD
jgi:CMP/dCMP kinase